MNSKLFVERSKYLRNNMLSYEELLGLSSDRCVKVSRTYFHYLMAVSELLEIKEKDIYRVFHKYLEIDNMQFFLRGVKSGVSSYYLMSASDIRYLVSSIKDKPILKTAFLKSDVKVEELNRKHAEIRRQFIEKRKDLNSSCHEKNIEEYKSCYGKLTDNGIKILTKTS